MHYIEARQFRLQFSRAIDEYVEMRLVPSEPIYHRRVAGRLFPYDDSDRRAVSAVTDLWFTEGRYVYVDLRAPRTEVERANGECAIFASTKKSSFWERFLGNSTPSCLCCRAESKKDIAALLGKGVDQVIRVFERRQNVRDIGLGPDSRYWSIHEGWDWVCELLQGQLMLMSTANHHGPHIFVYEDVVSSFVEAIHSALAKVNISVEQVGWP